MKNHWQPNKFLPFQKILSPQQLNNLSFYYQKLMSKLLDRYEVEEPYVSKDNYKQISKSKADQLNKITGLEFKNLDIINLNQSFGNYIKDADGNDILDLYMNNGFNALGYNHRNIIRNTKLEKFQLYSIQNFTNIPSSEYSEELKELHKLAPTGCDDVITTIDEDQAIDYAVRLAGLGFLQKNPDQRAVPYKILTFEGGNYQINSIQIPFPNLKYPNEENSQENKQKEDEIIRLFGQVIEEIYAENHRKGTEFVVPAMIIEPIQYKAGVKYASSEFYKKIMMLCKKADIKVILDETYTCGWATGRLFSYYQWCLEQTPDIVVFGGRMNVKGLFYSRNLITSIEDLNEIGLNYKLKGHADILNFKRLMELKKCVYNLDWLDMHCSNFFSSVKTEFADLKGKTMFNILNFRGKGKIFAFDVEHEVLRDEIIHLAELNGFKISPMGRVSIVFTPSLMFTEIHFNYFKEFLISLRPSTVYISKI